MISDLIYYLLPVLLILIPAVLHLRSKKKTSEIHHAVLKEAQESGLTEPPSLHPVVDLSICMGSGACVRACPEKALGVIKGKGILIKGKILGVLKGQVKVFIYTDEHKSMLVMEQVYDSDLPVTGKEFEQIAMSFKFK